MPRIPYAPADLPGPIADAIRARRGDRGLTPLDQALLQSPSIAEDDRANEPCPVPGLEAASDSSAPSYPTTPFNYSHGLVQVSDNVNLATKVHFNSMQSPWIIFVNSFMTNLTMWNSVLPAFTPHFNIITYDQRGHGFSSTPVTGCTLDELADDVAAIQAALGVEKLHAVVGVSQGGATALNFAIRHHDKVEGVVACDTQAISPEANRKAWDERIEMAQKEGMLALANVTVPRWFGPGSGASESVRSTTTQLVASTSIEGFEKSARSLQGYDLVANGLKDVLKGSKTLLVAGSADGKLPEALSGLASDTGVEFVKIESAGHLPMCDQPKQFTDKVLSWLLKK